MHGQPKFSGQGTTIVSKSGNLWKDIDGQIGEINGFIGYEMLIHRTGADQMAIYFIPWNRKQPSGGRVDEQSTERINQLTKTP